ncbi:MAG: hypothetical protein Q7V62_07660, partial [Actinomycetota bacterium]|nr:hypothetical protein [Actinomycetota bacterium]
VADGDTGVVCDTSSIDSLRDGVLRARALVQREGRAARAREMVRSRLGIEQMAATLTDVYRSACSVPSHA